MKSSLSTTTIFIYYLFFITNIISQEESKNAIKALNDDVNFEDDSIKNIDRFDRWAYSDKKHDAFLYFAPMFQYGTGTPENAFNLHHDFGVMYRWFMVNNDKAKINLQGWLEQTSFWAGEPTSDFSKKTGMISSPNASIETDYDLDLGSFYLEAFLFKEKLDITLGKFDPLFLTNFTNYSGWDKYNYFSKSAASDPVPDMGSGMGIYSEYHISKEFSFGGLIVDNEPRNNFLYIPKFEETSWNYMGFLRFKLGSKKDLYSNHNFAYFFQSKTENLEAGSGFIYTGNQGLSKNIILVLKYSNASGRIDKLNAAYVAGLTFKNPLGRKTDQTGFAIIVNERNNQYEYGLDTYWRFFINSHINISSNFQMYYTAYKNINTIIGLRTFITY